MIGQSIPYNNIDEDTVLAPVISLPDGWKPRKLAELSKEFISGGTPATNRIELWGGTIPWTTSAPISKDDIILKQAQRFITERGILESATHIVSAGSLLVATRVGVGKAVVNVIDIAISQDLTGVVLNNSLAFPAFIAYQLKTERLQNILHGYKRGTTIKGISRFDLQTLEIYLPSLPEQRAIAHILQTVQDTIEARCREIELEQERKAALMEYLFTHGTRHEQTKLSEIGKIPASWQVVRLGELCATDRGILQTGPFGSQLHAADYKECGIPVINPTHMGTNTVVEEQLPLISEQDAKRLSRHSLKEGDILISRRGDFSHYSYITERYAGWLCGTGCLLIRLNNSLMDNYFLSVYIGSEAVQNYLAYTAIGSTMPNLNTQILANLPVVLPPVSEQRAIAKLLQAAESKISAEKRELILLEELFDALLEELMTGRLSTIPLIEKESVS